MNKSIAYSKVQEFLKRGNEIGNQEFHPAKGGFPFSYVGGPLFESWMNEINILNERHLSDHPLHNSIHTTFFHRKNRPSAYEDMMGHLQALSRDTEYFEIPQNEDAQIIPTGRKTIAQLLEEDIKRCQTFLENPEDEQLGQDIYTEITGRYDGLIHNFGFGLYQYIPALGFYDPEISGETLIYNIKKLTSKMVSYLAVNYPPEPTTNRPTQGERTMSKKVFIVHGHDNEAILDVARTLEKDDFEAIILREQPDGGLTIIEKIEQYTDVDFAVVLYTQCDKGRAKAIPVEQERFRARQNVVFEHGYLIGKLGRNHVCALVKGDVETPGDISGVVYVPMDEHGAWKMRLARNMQDIGLPVDMNKFCR